MKTYLVIGLGRFGSAAAEKLYDLGHEVLIMDEDEELVRPMADKATHGAIGDARDMQVLRAAGAAECDCAIVAIGEDLAASVVITMNLKDLGVPYIVCKAKNETYKRALERVGADRVVIPEREMAIRMVYSLGSASFLDYISVSEEYGLAEITPPGSWQGKNLRELNARGKYHVNVLSIKRGADGSLLMSPGAEDTVLPGDTIMVMGRNEDLGRLQKL
jgi:trk system potassium uptake protein TrkA